MIEHMCLTIPACQLLRTWMAYHRGLKPQGTLCQCPAVAEISVSEQTRLGMKVASLKPIMLPMLWPTTWTAHHSSSSCSAKHEGSQLGILAKTWFDRVSQPVMWTACR